jgi:hypothetical protein
MFWQCQMSSRLPRVVNGVRKVTPPDEELKIIVFSPLALHYINEVLRLLTTWRLEGVATCPCRTRFPTVEFSLTHFPPVDLDFSLTDFPPASFEVVLNFLLLPTPPVFVFPARLPMNTHYPGKLLVSVSVRTEERVQPLLYLSISKSYQLSSTDSPLSTVGW